MPGLQRCLDSPLTPLFVASDLPANCRHRIATNNQD